MVRPTPPPPPLPILFDQSLKLMLKVKQPTTHLLKHFVLYCGGIRILDLILLLFC